MKQHHETKAKHGTRIALCIFEKNVNNLHSPNSTKMVNIWQNLNQIEAKIQLRTEHIVLYNHPKVEKWIKNEENHLLCQSNKR